MSTSYDENLSKNKLFETLKREYADVFGTAIAERWVICVPRITSIVNQQLCTELILSHILVPDEELPETHFQTLNGEQVCICNGFIKMQSDPNNVIKILFTETYYAKDSTKYDVLCIERPIGQDHAGGIEVYTVQSLRDCIDLLLVESTGGENLMEKIDECVHYIITENEFITRPVELQSTIVHNLYEKCFNMVLKDDKIRKKCSVDSSFLENAKVSVESYIQHRMYSVLMQAIVTSETDNVGKFNKIVRNISELQLQDMLISETIADKISTARHVLSCIDGYSTVLGKCGCLRRTLNEVSGQLSTDDLLPVLIFLIIKSGVHNWMAQLMYIKQFHYSESSDYMGGEYHFLVSTLEAAITYIHSGQLYSSYIQNFDIALGDTLLEEHNPIGTYNITKIIASKTSSICLTKLFSSILDSDVEPMMEILNSSLDSASMMQEVQYCHPLCSCDRCENLQIRISRESKISVDSCNDAGLTALHVASACGKSLMIDALLQKGANPRVVDFSGSTPLHYACLYGNQNASLLLAYATDKINEQDNYGNTPLHLAASNGHEDCIKALLYFSEHSNIALKVNCVNSDGDTPLHIASRLCYKSIVSILMNYNADPTIKNNNQCTPSDLCQSTHVLDLLNDVRVDSIDLLNTSSRKAHPLSRKSSELDFSDEIKLMPKEEYGVRPHSANCIKKVDKLFKAIKNHDLKQVKHYFGFGETDSPMSSATYKCHPLCQCDDCTSALEMSDSSCDAGSISEHSDNDEQNLDINICNSDGYTPLHIAAMYGKSDIVRWLLDMGVKPNVRLYRKMSTPLHLASQSQHVGVVKMLLDTPTCKINLQDSNGNTALHYACINGNTSLAETFLKYEPDLQIRNTKGRSPLSESEHSLAFSVANLLKTSIVKRIESDS